MHILRNGIKLIINRSEPQDALEPEFMEDQDLLDCDAD